MAEESNRSGEQNSSAWVSIERFIEEVHRAESAVAALKKIDALIPSPDKKSLLIIKRIIKQALINEV